MIRNFLTTSAADHASAPSRLRVLTTVLLSLHVTTGYAQQGDRYDYQQSTALTVGLGTQALMICNGLFVSNRTLEQVYEQELRLNRTTVLPPSMVTIDRERRTVAVGGGGNSPFPVMRAVYREGLGAVVLAPNQTFADIDDLPLLEMPPPRGDPAKIPWPDGDLVPHKPLLEYLEAEALEAAADFAFDRESHGHPSQITLSLLIVHKGDIIYERYAPGVDFTTKTRTWSTAKSIASTLIGIMVGRGKLALDEPLPYTNWGPRTDSPASAEDPRSTITLRNVLHMSSGLYPVDNERCHAVGSCLSYFAGASSVNGALDRGLVREPGTHWDYENYDTILALLALKTVIGNQREYLEFPRRELFDRIGMRNTIAGVDRFGDFVMSSQVYTNARDLARLGLLYLNNGLWNGERMLPESWVTFVRTPAPSTLKRGGFYGGQWWLVPDNRTDIPPDAYSTAGLRGQYTIVVPSYDLVIVRRGLDWLPRRHGFSRWDLTREVLMAFPDSPRGEKPKPSSSGSTGGSPATARELELLYVGNNQGGTISVIAVPSFEVIGEFNSLPDRSDRDKWPVKAKKADDLVATSSGEVLYVSRPITRDIAAFSTATEKLLWRLPTPGQPDHFALSRDDRHLFVSLLNEAKVVAIDTESRSVVGSIPTAPQPHGIFFSPNGERVYIGALTGDQITIADTRTLEVVRKIEFDDGVRPFVIAPDEKKLYVQLSKLHGFVEYNLEQDRITKIIPLPNPDNVPHQKSYPHTAHHGLVLTPDHQYLCAVATMEGYTALLSAPELELLATVPTGKEPSWIIASLDGKYCYVSGRKSNDVFVISLEERKAVKRIPVGDYPQRMWTTRVPQRRVSRSQ